MCLLIIGSCLPHLSTMKDKEFWYSLDKVRSYNALFNFIILLRGVGKTYAFKKFAIKEYLYKGYQFMYLRRTDVEIRDAMASFMNDIVKEFPTYEFRISTMSLQVNEPDPDNEGQYLGEWQTVGYFAYLSNARRKKSVSYDGVKYMCFDEFLLPDKDKGRYLKEEVMTFFEFYDTVARMRDVQVFFMANAMSTVNPYFQFFQLRLPRNKNGILRIADEIVVEYHDNRDFREAKQATRFGSIIAGTEYERYALNNEFITETSDHIEAKSHSYYEMTVLYNGLEMGIYKEPRTPKRWVSYDIDWTNPYRYSYRQPKDGYYMFKSKSSNTNIRKLVDCYETLNLYYESQELKKNMEQLMSCLL